MIDIFNLIDLIAFLFAIGLGFGLACWILGTLLDKSNNIGDYRGTNDNYNAFIHFTARQDEMSYKEKSSFCNNNFVKVYDPSSEPSGSDKVRRLSDEELAKLKGTSAEDAAARREAMLTASEGKIWCGTSSRKNLSGVFGKLDDKDS